MSMRVSSVSMMFALSVSRLDYLTVIIVILSDGMF